MTRDEFVARLYLLGFKSSGKFNEVFVRDTARVHVYHSGAGIIEARAIPFYDVFGVVFGKVQKEEL